MKKFMLLHYGREQSVHREHPRVRSDDDVAPVFFAGLEIDVLFGLAHGIHPEGMSSSRILAGILDLLHLQDTQQL